MISLLVFIYLIIFLIFELIDENMDLNPKGCTTTKFYENDSYYLKGRL